MNSKSKSEVWVCGVGFFFHFSMIKFLQGIWFSIQNANGNFPLHSNYLKITYCSACVTYVQPCVLPVVSVFSATREWLQKMDSAPPHIKQQSCLQCDQILSAPRWLMVLFKFITCTNLKKIQVNFITDWDWCGWQKRGTSQQLVAVEAAVDCADCCQLFFGKRRSDVCLLCAGQTLGVSDVGSWTRRPAGRLCPCVLPWHEWQVKVYCCYRDFWCHA